MERRSTGCGPARRTRPAALRRDPKSATISFGQSLVAGGPRAGRRPPPGLRPLAGRRHRRSASTRSPTWCPIAKRHGARIVIVNAEPTEMDDLADAVLRGPIGEVLPALVVGMS